MPNFKELIMIKEAFLKHASEIIANTDKGLTTTYFLKKFNAYAVKFDVELPISSHPFPEGISNKRVAFFENLKSFSAEQQFEIISELSNDINSSKENLEDLKKLKISLVGNYKELAISLAKDRINDSLIEETQHWLAEYPEVFAVYSEALQKYSNNIFERNTLDDIRVSLEILLKKIFGNEKSLENQCALIGEYVIEKGGSKELTNMFLKLVDYFCKYQNTYVKHNDNVNKDETEIIIELASSFMKYLLKIKNKA
jgi:hypothetical protein